VNPAPCAQVLPSRVDGLDQREFSAPRHPLSSFSLTMASRALRNRQP